MKKKFYHMSRELDKDIEVFIPRIPSSMAIHEERQTARVCISEHFENCLSSISYVMDGLDDNGEYRPLKVYEFELEENELVHPEEVFKHVPDAIIHREFWSLKEIKPVRSFVIKPTYIATSDRSPITVAMLDFDYADEC